MSKALEELRKAFDSLIKENETLGKMLSKEIEKNRALEIIKNNDYLRNFILNWANEYDEVNNTNLYGSFKEISSSSWHIPSTIKQ